MRTLLGFALTFAFLLIFSVMANAQVIVRQASHGRTVHKTKTAVVSVKPAHGRAVAVRPSTPKAIVHRVKRPGKNYFWIDAHWKWSTARAGYVWVEGRWERNRKGFRYHPGVWVAVDGGYTWQAGVWIRI